MAVASVGSRVYFGEAGRPALAVRFARSTHEVAAAVWGFLYRHADWATQKASTGYVVNQSCACRINVSNATLRGVGNSGLTSNPTLGLHARHVPIAFGEAPQQAAVELRRASCPNCGPSSSRCT
jgi:hypothetical protein